MSGSGYVSPVEIKGRKSQLVVEHPLFGKATDDVVAAACGVSVSTVWNVKQRLGMTCRQSAESLVLEQEDLGKTPDRVIAERLGLADTTVGKYRRMNDIAPFSPEQSRRCVGVRAVEKNAISELMLGWGR